MPEPNPTKCPKCGAGAGPVSCPSCGAVYWKELAGWTAGLSVVIAACALVAVYAASWWLKAGAASVALGCAVGLFGLRAALLRAVRTAAPDFPWHEGRQPWQVILWSAGAVGLLLAATTAGFVVYDAAGGRAATPAASVTLPQVPPPPVAQKGNPLPVAVTFRPAPTGTGQAVYLTGAPAAKPLSVKVATHAGEGQHPEVWVAPGSRKQVRTAGRVATFWALVGDRERTNAGSIETVVVVRPGVETEVVWAGDRTFRLKHGQAVTLTSPGYDTLTTASSVPLRPVPTANAPPATGAEALKELEEVAKQVRQARTTNATAMLLGGKFDDAIKEFDAVLAEDPKDVYALNGRGFAHAQKGDLEKAFADLDASIQARPEWAPTYRLRGRALFAHKHYLSAMGEYTDAIRVDPKAEVGLLRSARDPFSAHLERALAWLEVGEFEWAVRDCTEELRLNPNSPDAHEVRGSAHQKLGNEAAAKADRDRADELRGGRQKR